MEASEQLKVEVKKILDGIQWPIEYGNIKVQVRGGKTVSSSVELTIKHD